MRYKEYKKVDLPWLEEAPRHWDIERAKFYIYSKKEINKDKKIMNVLSLTLNGVIRNDAENPIGLSPSDYSTYQIFNNDNLVFKLIDLDNIRTSRVGLVNELGIMSSAYIRGIVDNSILYLKYIYYWYYKLYIEEVYNKLGSGVRATLSSSELLEMEIPIPPKEEQEQIAKFLDWKINDIDRLIEIKKKKKYFLLELKDRHLDYCFGNLIENNSENFGEKHIKIKYLTKIITSNSNEGKHFIGLENIESNTGRILSKIEDLPVKNDGIDINKNMIIFGKLRPYLAKVYEVEKESKCSSEFLVLECLNDLNSEFMKFLMLSPTFVRLVNESTYGAKMPRANTDFITSIKIKKVLLQEQIQLVMEEKIFFEKHDLYIKNIQSQINNLRQLKQSLISDVVTGKIDVRNVIIPEYDKVSDIEDDAILYENLSEEV